MRRKMLALGLLAALLLPAALFAGGEAEGGGEGEEISKITGVFDIILTKESGSDAWAEKFKELTGVEIEIIKPPHNQYPQILGATFASGDLPDICEIQTGDYLTYAASGNLVPLDPYIKASKQVKSVPSQFIEAYRLKDGKVYAFPLNRGGGCVAYIRQDWLDNLGLEVPANYEEFYEVLRAFTFDDPDRNGKNDTIGYTLPFSVPAMEFDYYNRFIMQDAFFGFEKKKNKWVDGFTEPAMVGALERFQKLYAEGLIDSEFFSNKTSTARSKIYEGQAGIMEYWSGVWAVRFDESAKNTDPRAEVLPIPPIKEARYLNRVAVCFGITTKAQNPGAVFDKFINTMLDKGEGQKLFTYGIEGMHYRKEGDTYVMMPDPVNPDRTFDKSYVHPELTLNDWPLIVRQDPLLALSREIHVKYSDQLFLPQGGDNYLKYVGELNTVKQEVFSKIVIGDYTVQEGLDLYKTKAAALHIADIMAELNE